MTYGSRFSLQPADSSPLATLMRPFVDCPETDAMTGFTSYYGGEGLYYQYTCNSHPSNVTGLRLFESAKTPFIDNIAALTPIAADCEGNGGFLNGFALQSDGDWLWYAVTCTSVPSALDLACSDRSSTGEYCISCLHINYPLYTRAEIHH